MALLTAHALSEQEQLYARRRVEITHAHAENVVHEEQIHKYFSQRGLQEGHDIVAEAGLRNGRLGIPDQASANGSAGTGMGGFAGTTSSNATNREANPRLHNGDSALDTLGLFMPRQGQQQIHEGATPLERHLTLGHASDPIFMRRAATTQAQYGNMENVEIRAQRAQVMADRAVRDGQARRGSSMDGNVSQ